MKLSLPFEIAIPPGWEVLRFGRVVTRSQESGKPDARLLSVFLDQGVVPRDSREDNFNRLGADLGKYLVVNRDDLVFNKLRTWQGGLGVSAFDGIVSPAYYVCRPTSATNSRYLHFLLRSAPYLNELTRISKWMPPSQFDISWDDLRRLPIPVPPIHVQGEIADYLDREISRLNELVEAKRRMVQLMDERWQAVMYDAVSGRLTTQGKRRRADTPWLEDIPDHWREGQLKLVARIGSGHTPSRSHPQWWEDPTIPWITTGEVAQMRADRIEYIDDTREHISELGLANSSAEVHPAGTVVLCRTASAGYSAIMGRDMATSQDFATWTCGPLLRPRFLLLCLRAMRQDLLGRLAMGSTHKTIYMPDIESIMVPIPPVMEQEEAIDVAHQERSALDGCVERLRAQVNLLEERRQALITAAVTGQLDIPEAA